MRSDLLLFELGRVEASEGTVESLRAYYTKAILGWSPHQSTSPSSNLQEEQRLAVYKDVLELVERLGGLSR
jgi:hypothetical protein